MATTQNGIYYPDNYQAVADIPADMQTMAESVDTALDTKVDKTTGKGLSTNDFTDNDKNKLDGIETQAQVNILDSIEVNGTPQPITNKTVDISVPTKISDLINDSDFLVPDDISGKEDISNKTQIINESSTAIQYPSAKAVFEEVNPIKLENNILHNIINQFPTVIGEGSNFTIQNTIEAPFVQFNINGNLENDTNIKTATGNNRITVAGKNFCPTQTFHSTTLKRIIGGDTVYGIPIKTGETFTASFVVTELPTVADYRIQFIESSDNSVVNSDADIPNRLKRTVKDCNELKGYTISLTAEADGYLYLRCVPNNFALDNIQIERNSTATTFETYKGQTIELGLGIMELCKINTTYDYLYKNENKWYKKPNILKIDSYNGETITTDYISSTGELSTGATVYYINPTTDPSGIEITDSTLISQLNNIQTMFSVLGNTNIYVVANINNAPIIVNAKALLDLNSIITP